MATTPSTAARPFNPGDDSADSLTAVQKLREQADAVVQRIQPQISAVTTYVRDEPTKALLISAATGAALMGLFALIMRSGSGRSQAPARSAMAAIRDAALELADSAQTMALDALDATKQRAADALGATQKRATGAYETAQHRAADTLGATQKRAAAAADSVSESVADAWKKVRDQAGPMVDKIKPQLDAAAAYAKEEPARTAIGVAAAAAIIAGLIALTRHADDDTFS